jgi:hypothetical protein
MKKWYVLLASFTLISAQAQSTNPPSRTALSPPAQVSLTPRAPDQIEPSQPENVDAGLQAQLGRPVPPVVLALQQPKPNEIVSRGFTFSGIAVHVAKTENLLQLINPAAPAEYGSAEDSLVLDPIDVQPSGLKVFSFQF